MIVHSYLTNGFFDMAKVFLRSLEVAEGMDNAPLVWLDTRGLEPPQVEELRRYYVTGKLYVNNSKIPMRQWAEEAEITLKELKEYKRQCEGRYVNNRNRVWKLMTAGDDRVQHLFKFAWPPAGNPMTEVPRRANGTYESGWKQRIEYIAHFDIDTLFRKPISSPAKELMNHNDLWLKLRPNNEIVKARITIDVILMRPTTQVGRFFNMWIHEIGKLRPRDRPIGWGQASCWYAFVKLRDRLSYNTLPLEWGLPGRNKPDDLIWTGNVHKLAKKDCVKLFNAEMKKWKT